MPKLVPAAVMLFAAVSVGGCSTVSAVKDWWNEDDTLPDNGVRRDETPRVQIEVGGVREELADNVRATVALASEACDAPRWRVEREFETSEEGVKRALRAFGHYQPTIEKTFEQAAGCWLARYQIDAGPRVQFGELDVRIEGDAGDDPAFREFLSDLPVRSGEPLDHSRYEGIKSRIQSIASQRGYFDGRFTTSRLEVDVDAGSADVRLLFESGTRFVLGSIDIEQDAFDEDLIQRLTLIEPGQPYDSADLANQNRAYNDSGYFSAVDVSPQLSAARTSQRERSAEERESGEPPQVPVEVLLEPRPKHSYTAGVGYATDTGPRVRLGYENRRLNRLGHRWTADTALSPSDSSLDFGYRIPLEDPRTEWLSFQAGYRIEDTKTAETSTARVGATRTGSRFGWLETQSLAVTHDAFTIAGVDETTFLVVPGISWQRTEADDPLRPTRGWSALLALRGTHEAMLSDTSFMQLHTRTNAVYGLPWGDRLLGRLELGATGVTDFDLLPPDYRFFAGGDTSIRGYGFEQLGPTDAQGLVVGGKYLAVGSLEYEHSLNDKWSIAGFVDAGNAFDDFDEDLKVGVGGGVRWRSPVGPLRLDIGFPLGDDDADSFRLHVRFGPDL